MKKIILVLMMGLVIVGCEESSSPAATSSSGSPAATPSQPAVNTYKTVTVQLNTSEPTGYIIIIERYNEATGFDIANPVLISGTTSQNQTIKTFQIEYKCRVYIQKQTATLPSSVSTKLDSDFMSSQTFGPAYGYHALVFTDALFFN